MLNNPEDDGFMFGTIGGMDNYTIDQRINQVLKKSVLVGSSSNNNSNS